MKRLSIMIKPASSLCNLRCRYCFYADVAQQRQVCSFGIMQPAVRDKILSNLRDWLKAGDSIPFAFQGGEPTLAGLDWFRSFTAVTDGWRDVQVNYAIQTNATTLDNDWCAFLKQHKFLVGVSWDILPACHNAARVDAEGEGTCRRLVEKIALLERWGVEYNVLCTLTNAVARHPDQVWAQLLKYDIRYVQFTPCLGRLDNAKSPYALTPARFYSFYQRLFCLWFAEFTQGRYRSVKLFDDIVNFLAYGIPTACGIDGKCRPQLVVEANGSAYPCDFYCIDEFCMGNLADQPLLSVLTSPAAAAFLQCTHQQPALCHTCTYQQFCGGGCKRMQRYVCCAEGNTSCGYQKFLKMDLATLQKIAAWHRSQATFYAG